MLLGRNESIFHLENKSFTKINFGSLGASRINVILHPMRSSYKYLKLHSRVTSLKKKKKKRFVLQAGFDVVTWAYPSGRTLMRSKNGKDEIRIAGIRPQQLFSIGIFFLGGNTANTDEK